MIEEIFLLIQISTRESTFQRFFAGKFEYQSNMLSQLRYVLNAIHFSKHTHRTR